MSPYPIDKAPSSGTSVSRTNPHTYSPPQHHHHAEFGSCSGLSGFSACKWRRIAYGKRELPNHEGLVEIGAGSHALSSMCSKHEAMFLITVADIESGDGLMIFRLFTSQ
ncbi:hypothetical protein COCC4DRAFT_28919 [Bipolaris maydis ATCC 48331]|uniref:Uncharacterized protein n=1 Tax=Cochliobolus heterostrophus (strain C4 / ATCC 48331 / race T) TaxID=665024 RepID=N4WRK8_COCH4|nr:uncharacterized protein COCC4DRAFT_28919 [Bipolaris maydis ATCC 48331]ENH98847.1 hypothetical protein COCC4DRAFT_28919 [Bipolaris maydis ATCC 48331]KAJ5028827.1 hypothetical protein J3E73DRAFT_255358 [Bipolaris maydis]